MLVQCWYKKLRIAIYRHFKQLFAAGQRLPWQIKSTLIILVFLPVRARYAAFYRTLRTALREHILPKNRAKIRKCGKSRQIEDMSSSKNVVENGVFYYRLPWVTLGDLGCRGLWLVDILEFICECTCVTFPAHRPPEPCTGIPSRSAHRIPYDL